MLIKILGTRGKIAASAPGHVKHSGILIDKKILFDLGEKENISAVKINSPPAASSSRQGRS